ncbi:hypothetical protein CVT24_001362, partial [Panaeolus cyanescens]
QNSQWNSHHKKICKTCNQWQTSSSFQALSAHQKMDATLLSHMLSTFLLSPGGYLAKSGNIVSQVLSLLPFQEDPSVLSALCPIKPGPPKDLVVDLHARFGNNNFAVHSHLTTIGHGVFPAASRVFNHSCVPNAAAKYVLDSTSLPSMQVVALTDIRPGEEICIPYVDPALLETRQQIFRFSYGFQCSCTSCQFLGNIGPIPKAPTDTNKINSLATQLCDFMGIDFTSDISSPPKSLDTLPRELYPVLNETFIQTISERFSKASHEGEFQSAQSSGKTLLALYALIYPPNYPQIGMHLLEMSKSTWNHIIASGQLPASVSASLEEETRILLATASRILNVYGAEGDQEWGPLREISTLQSLLDA